MSNSIQPADTGTADQLPAMPRAMIHKQILDAAAAQPTASLETLAAEVMGASTGLVERVLDEYGDPAAQSTETEQTGDAETDATHVVSPESTDSPMTEQDAHDAAEPASTTDTAVLAQLSEKQRATLRAIREHPEATQRELAELFGVSDSAINLRVNSIDDFEWEHRQEFVTTVFDNETMNQESTEPFQPSLQDLADRIDDLGQHVEALEHQIDERAAPTQTLVANPDLTHKIVHACLTSNQITEDEELHILQTLMQGGPSE